MFKNKKIVFYSVIGAVAVAMLIIGIIIGVAVAKPKNKDIDNQSVKSTVTETVSSEDAQSEETQISETEERKISSASSKKTSSKKTTSKKETKPKNISEEEAIKIGKASWESRYDVDIDDFVLDLDDPDGIPKYKFGIQEMMKGKRCDFEIHAVTGAIILKKTGGKPDYDFSDEDGDSIRPRNPISPYKAMAHIEDAFGIELNRIYSDSHIPWEYVKHPKTPYYYIEFVYEQKTHYGIVDAASGEVIAKSESDPLSHLMQDGFITEEDAVAIAKKDFKVAVEDTSVYLDIYKNDAWYVVTIYHEGWETWEYDIWDEEEYLIEASTGKIIDHYDTNGY